MACLAAMLSHPFYPPRESMCAHSPGSASELADLRVPQPAGPVQRRGLWPGFGRAHCAGGAERSREVHTRQGARSLFFRAANSINLTRRILLRALKYTL